MNAYHFHSVVAEATKRFAAHTEDPKKSPIHADLRSPIFRAALKSDPAKVVEFLKKEWYNTPAVDGKEVCLTALGRCTDESIVTNNLLPFLFNLSPPAPASDSVPPADMHILATSLSQNSVGRPLLWKFIKENWDQIEKKIGGNPIILDRFIGVGLSRFSSYEIVDELDAFFADKDRARFDRTLETVKDKIRGRAAYKERDGEVLKEWLTANGFTE